MAMPTFSMIPDDEQLAVLEREFSFVECTNSDPQVLTRQQIEQFNEQGFIKGVRIFDPSEADQHRQYFDQLLAWVQAEGGDGYSISTAHMKYGYVYDLLAHPKIVACVADLLGQNVIGWGSHFFCKLPRDGRQVTWHQDASYWPLTPTRTVTVWLAIDDADRENACMRFVPGSHRLGLIEARSSNASEGNVLNQTIEDINRFGEPVDVQLSAGEISIHSDLLLHGSEANDSDRRRCGLTLRYAPTEVRAHLGWNAKGVVVAGEDSTGHWANPPRPEGE